MGSLIKNQILKHLSKFTKNLSPDKIQISTLKGEGELSNLELDEMVLMDLMDLPTWMKLTKAFCNRVSIKVQWTKLKSQPISLYLDEVVLEIQTCAEPRPPCSSAPEMGNRSEGRYGFVDKVIDGIYVHINSVLVQFRSDKFNASLQLSRVKVQSMTPNWLPPTDIRQTRIRNEPVDAILLFKEVDWQTTRIEANASDEASEFPSTPLRLIANQSKIRIVLKKKLSDCSVISSRIIFLLDDILWVLTDTQLKSAILYANSLSDMIEKSSEQSKRLAAKKLQKQAQSNNAGAEQLYLQQQQQQQQQRARSQTNETRIFQKFDVATTSYHMITARVDLHLCDDSVTDKESSPKHNQQINGGAMQITLYRLSVDYYPFHFADVDLIMSSGGERKQWYRYTDNQGSRNSWVQELFKVFRTEVNQARNTCKIVSPTQSPAHGPSGLRSPSQSSPSRPPPNSYGVKSQGHSGEKSAGSEGHGNQKPKIAKLLESCMVLRVEEFIVYRVSTSDNRRSTPKKFLSSDKKALHLPADMSVIHVEYTDYFFTEGIDYPVPHANLYILVNPIRLNVDYLTVLWANYFSLNLAQMVETQEADKTNLKSHVDIKLEALMPRIVISEEEKVDNQPDRPTSLQIQFSKVTVTNTHIENKFTFQDLADLLQQYADCDIFKSTEFPNDQNKLHSLPKLFEDFTKSRINPFLSGYAQNLIKGFLPQGFNEGDFGSDALKMLLHTNTLKRDDRCDIWTVCIDQLWLEFLGVPTSRTRPVPFVESFPLTLWMCEPGKVPESMVNSEQVNGVESQKDDKTKSQDARTSKKLLKAYYSDESEDGSSASDTYSSRSTSYISSEQSDCSPDNEKPPTQGNVQYASLEVADLHVVAKFGSKVRAQLNHSQYLFLMRLLDSVSTFQSQLNADIEEFFSHKPNDKASGSFVIPLILPELEFAMVCPYIAELLPLTHPADLINSPMMENEEAQEGFTEMEGDLHGNYVAPPIYEIETTDQMITVTQTYDGEPGYTQSFLQTPEPYLPHSQSDSTLTFYSGQGIDQHQAGESLRRDSHSTDNVSQNSTEMAGASVHLAISDSGLSSLGSSMASQQVRPNSKLTPTVVKKSFASGVSNFSNFMGKIKNKLDPDDIEESDSISLRTDTSDDDDFEFVIMDDSEAPAFHHGNMSETGSTTDTDDLSSVFAESTSASKARETVSVIVYRLSGTEVILQSWREDLTVRIQTQALEVEETGNIVYEDFYNKLSSQLGYLRTPVDRVSSNKYPIRFKYRTGPSAEADAPRGGELGVMDARVHDYTLTFRMSSILNMADFVVEEKVGTPMPMHVTVDRLKLILKEDRLPPNSQNPSSSQPLHLNIHSMFIRRHDDAVFHMTTSGTSLPADLPTSLSQVLDLKPLYNGISPQTDALGGDTNAPTADLGIPSLNDLDLRDLPEGVKGRMVQLQHQNLQMKGLLEKLDSHTQDQEQELDKVKAENKQLRDQLRKLGVDGFDGGLEEGAGIGGGDGASSRELIKVNKDIEAENKELMERVVNLEDQLKQVTQEKDSMVTIMQHLQDDLMTSEMHRQRRYTGPTES